jgi:acyl carrier protein
MEQILDMIQASVRELAGQGVLKTPLPDPAPATVLFGPRGALDSLGLVSLLVLVEEKLADELGVSLTLADERAMAQESSPFRTVATLAAYVDARLAEG